MIAALDFTLSFVVRLRDQLSLVEDGTATIVTSDGVRHQIYQPITIGTDFIEFAYGPGKEFPKAIVSFKSLANVTV